MAARILGFEVVVDVVVIGGIFREVLDGDTTPRPRLGGSGLTCAIVAAHFGVNTALVSYVGAEDADVALAMLGAAGVDTKGVAILPGASGTFVFPTEQQRPWPMYRPAESVPHDVPRVDDSKVYVIFGIPDFDPIASGWLTDLPAEAKLLWDRQGWISRSRDWKAAARLKPIEKIYIANLDEAMAEFEVSDEEALFQLLPPVGYRAALVKRGAEGSVVLDARRGGSSKANLVQGIPVAVTNTIGSGDVFAGALAAELARGNTIDESAMIANAAAGAFLRAGGDSLGQSFRAEVRSRFARTEAEP